MSRTIALVVGARPNFVKMAPVHRALSQLSPDTRLLLVHTGQHYDASMSDVFLDDLGLPHPDVFLDARGGSHAEQTARVLVGVEGVLLDRRPDLVVVGGDVNSTLAAALAAAKLHIPVAHVEAGLRSRDDRMPEEINRRLTDHMSSVLLAHSESARENLIHEGIDGDRIHLVGNTMIDSLLEYVAAARSARPWAAAGVDEGAYGLVTLHRPTLVDDDTKLAAVCGALAELGREMPLVFPVHPRTADRLRRLGLLPTLESARLRIGPPAPYLEFLGLEAGARFVITDSGGVQEETSALGVRCFTLRSTTERPVTVELGTNVVLGEDPAAIARIPDLLHQPVPAQPIPLWDGKAGVRAARVLLDAVGS